MLGERMMSLSDQVDALLPQTQCTKCGYEGCRPYAEAIESGEAQINRCPPGGTSGIEKLARLLDRPTLPLDPACGTEHALMVAVIDESRCIGCTLCVPACPVDAIVGAPKRMHSVIASQCTGCDLCVAPCPMDCIAMVAVEPTRAWTVRDAQVARDRYLARRTERAGLAQTRDVQAATVDQKQSIVAAAIQRARQRRDAASP